MKTEVSGACVSRACESAHEPRNALLYTAHGVTAGANIEFLTDDLRPHVIAYTEKLNMPQYISHSSIK